MTATKADFTPLDSSAATVTYPWDCFIQQRLSGNVNRMVADLVQPIYNQMHEVADQYPSGTPSSPHTLRLNAPYDNWSFLLEPSWHRVTGEVQSIEVILTAKIPSGVTAYVFTETPAQVFDPNVAVTDSRVQSLAGTGSFTSYTWTAPIRPENPVTPIAIYLRTSGFAVQDTGTAQGTSPDGIFDNVGTFAAPENEAPLRDDWWANTYEPLDVFHAVTADASAGPSFTQLSNINGAGTDEVFTDPPASGDWVAFSREVDQFDGVALEYGRVAAWTSATTVWEYWNGSTWAALSEVLFQVDTWKEAKSTYLVIWERPTEWRPTTINGQTGYFVRGRLSSLTLGGGFTYSTDSPRLDSASILRSRGGFRRVYGLEGPSPADTLLLNSGGVQSELGDFYLTGRAEFCEVGGLTIYPEAHPGIGT